MNLLELNWLNRFLVYKSIIHHLYIVLCVHHSRSSLLPSPFIPCTLFYLPDPTLFPLVIILWMSGSMRVFISLLNYFPSSPSPPTPPPWQLSFCPLSESVSILFVCSFCSLDSTWKWNPIALVPLWFHLTYYPLGPAMLFQKVRFPSCLRLSSIPLGKYATAFGPLIYQWALGWLSNLGCCQWHCSAHRGAYILLNPCFGFLWIYPQKQHLGNNIYRVHLTYIVIGSDS